MFNKVILIGNLTRDVELRYTQSGSAVAKFGLAVGRSWKDKNTGDKKDEVCFIDINIFGRSAEIANQYLSKGKKVLIEGRLHLEQWQDQTGQKRSKHSIYAESFQFLDSKGDSLGDNQQNDYQENDDYQQPAKSYNKNQSSSAAIEIGDDDIPF